MQQAAAASCCSTSAAGGAKERGKGDRHSQSARQILQRRLTVALAAELGGLEQILDNDVPRRRRLRAKTDIIKMVAKSAFSRHQVMQGSAGQFNAFFWSHGCERCRGMAAKFGF